MSVWEGSYAIPPLHLHTASPPCGRTACRLPGTCGTLLLPLRLGPLQQILSAGAAQMRAAVLHHHLAIDEAGLVGNQITREVGELGVVAMAAERVAVGPALLAALGPELAGGTRGGECARRDRDGANALRTPFHGEALGHRQHRSLCHC